MKSPLGVITVAFVTVVKRVVVDLAMDVMKVVDDEIVEAMTTVEVEVTTPLSNCLQRTIVERAVVGTPMNSGSDPTTHPLS